MIAPILDAIALAISTDISIWFLGCAFGLGIGLRWSQAKPHKTDPTKTSCIDPKDPDSASYKTFYIQLKDKIRLINHDLEPLLAHLRYSLKTSNPPSNLESLQYLLKDLEDRLQPLRTLCDPATRPASCPPLKITPTFDFIAKIEELCKTFLPNRYYLVCSPDLPDLQLPKKDETIVTRMIQNLILNAKKNIDSKTPLQIEIRPEQHNLLIVWRNKISTVSQLSQSGRNLGLSTLKKELLYLDIQLESSKTEHRQCSYFEVKTTIPKRLLHVNHDAEKPLKWVLIDDDSLVHRLWRAQVAPRNVELVSFYSRSDFLKWFYAWEHKSSTHLFFDFKDPFDGILNESFLEQILTLDPASLWITTGFSLADVQKFISPKMLKKIRVKDKTPPPVQLFHLKKTDYSRLTNEKPFVPGSLGIV